MRCNIQAWQIPKKNLLDNILSIDTVELTVSTYLPCNDWKQSTGNRNIYYKDSGGFHFSYKTQNHSLRIQFSVSKLMYGINSPAFDFACGTRLTEYIRYKIREETGIKPKISNLILSRIDLVSTQFFKTAAEMNTQLNAIKGFMRNDRHKCKIENTSCYIDTRLKSSKKDSGSNNSRFSVYDKNAEVKYRISRGTAKPNEIIDDNVLRYEIQLRGTKLKEHFGNLKLDSFLTNPNLCVQAFLYGLSIFGLDNDIITADTLKTAKENLINERIKGKKVQQRTLDKLTDYINKIENGTLTHKESNSEYKNYLAQSGFSEKYAETFRQFNCPGYICSTDDETAEPAEVMYNSRYTIHRYKSPCRKVFYHRMI